MKKTTSIMDASRAKARRLLKNHFGRLLEKRVVHHIDHNPMNNDPKNLMVLDYSTHIAYHKAWKLANPERHAEAMRIATKAALEKRSRPKNRIRELESLLYLYNEGLF